MHVEFGKTGTLTSQMHGHAPVVFQEAYRISSEKSWAMMSDNPKAGIRRAEISPTLDTTTPTPAKAQGGLMVVSVSENQRAEVRVSGVSNAITQPGGKPGQGNPCVLIQEKSEMVVAPTLTASNDPSRSPQSAEVTAQIAAVHEAAFSLAENTIGRKPENGGNGAGFSTDISYTLNATGVHGISTPRAAVRRLTPVECERLQGFPDNWTRIPYRGKSAENCPDAPRYKAIGNSWAVPCVRWIGERIKQAIEGENND